MVQTEEQTGTAELTKSRIEILISGFGGQGVIRMAQILGRCAINQGHRVTMLKSHGTETRGGYVRAQLVISPMYVDSPVVEHADLFVAFSAPAYKLAPSLKQYAPSGHLKRYGSTIPTPGE